MTCGCMSKLLIGLPATIAAKIAWAGPLLARLSMGYIFMLSGWGKLMILPTMVERFTDWGIPFPAIMTPLACGVEFVGGILLMLGLMTRISAGALAVTMVVAIASAQWENVTSLEDLFWLSEFAYFVIFTWLAIAGAGKTSLDYCIEKKYLSM